MRIIAHDEDSMTNLFFSEVHRHEKLEAFLALIEWRSSPGMPFDVAEAELHQQVNFSDFGRPDAIILVTDGRGRKHVVIVEVKLGTYLDSCELARTGKFDNRFNSRLNNQLALKYRAMVSLPSISDRGYITRAQEGLGTTTRQGGLSEGDAQCMCFHWVLFVRDRTGSEGVVPRLVRPAL